MAQLMPKMDPMQEPPVAQNVESDPILVLL